MRGDPTKIAVSGEEMLKAPSSMIMEARVFENTAMSYLESLPNVKIHRGKKAELVADSQGYYEIAGIVEIDMGGGMQVPDFPQLSLPLSGPVTMKITERLRDISENWRQSS